MVMGENGTRSSHSGGVMWIAGKWGTSLCDQGFLSEDFLEFETFSN